MDYISQFEKQGYLHLKQAIDTPTMDAFVGSVEEHVDSFLSDLHRAGSIESPPKDLPFDRRLYQAGGEEAFQLGRNGLGREAFHGESLYDFHRAPELLRVLQSLMAEEIVALPSFNVRPKMPQQGTTNTPWHQDAGYFAGAEGCTFFTCWIPLVPVTHEMGCLQVIEGSHAWPVLPHFTGDNPGNFLEVDPFEYTPETLKTIEMDVGDVLLFNQNTMHRSTANLTDKIRWNIDIRYGIAGEYQGDNSAILWGGGTREWRVTGERQTSLAQWQDMVGVSRAEHKVR